MPDHSQQENYSIDEMIDRLKNPPADDGQHPDGEWVTRADGSQAIRVRKRKRRTQQPKREEFKQRRRTRMIRVAILLVLLLTLASTAGMALIYANSSPFRDQVARLIGAGSGAGVKLEQFRVNPSRAVAGRMLLTWPEGNTLREISLTGVKADVGLSSLMGRTLAGDEVTCDHGTLRLGVPVAGVPRHATTPARDPRPVRFTRYAVPRLQVILGDPLRPFASLVESEASFQPLNAKKHPQLLLNRGTLAIRGWPGIRHDRSHIEFHGDEMDIVKMRLFHENDNRGAVNLSGTVNPYLSGQASQLDVGLESFLISGIAGQDMERLVSGRINTVPTPKSNYLAFTPGPQPATTMAVSFRNAPTWPIRLHAFPFLSGLARVIEDNWFEHPVFENDATGVLVKTSDSVRLESIDFRSPGRMAVRGNLKLDPNRRLDGELRIGIAEAMVEATPNPRLNAMTGPAGEDGYRWFTLKISGTAGVPADDFMRLLDAAKVAGQGPEANPAGVPDFEELTTPE